MQVRPRRGPVAALVLALVAVLIVPAAHAEPDTARLQQLERELDELRAEADEREAQRAAVDVRVAELRQERQRAQERLQAIEAELSEVVEQYNEAQVELDAVQRERADTQVELGDLQVDADALTDNVADHARRLYRMGRSIEFATMLSGDATDAGFKSTSLRFVLNAEQADLEQLTAVQERLQGLEGRLAEQERAAASARVRVEEELLAVESTYERHDAEVTQLTAVVERGEQDQADQQAAATAQQQAITAQQTAIADERARIDRLRAEQAAAARAVEEAAAAAAPASDRAPATSRPPAARTSTPTARPAPATLTPQPTPQPTPTPAPSARQSAQVAVDTALAQVGKPYVWGGTGPNGFDCSGLTSYAWRAAGVTIPRTSRAQASGLRNITRAELQVGDLVFYNSPISHVAIYAGNDTIVEASRRGVPVRTARLSNRTPVRYARP